MNFYDEVNSQNAVEWYEELPPHLRKTVDAELARTPSGEECSPSDDSALWKRVAKDVGGDRPSALPPEAHPGDGYTEAQLKQEGLRRRWINRYDELKIVQVVLELAPSLQKERKMLNQALGIGMDANGFPLQSEGLDDTQAATVRWIQQTGATPLEFLAETYRNEELKAGDRISAARAMLDFVHRKVPVKTEVETKDTTEVKLDAKVLKGLSDKELATLEGLLKKINT